MTGETENIEDSNKQNLIVQSVGNSWIICNSKSRPGFKYYFNSLTGESVWNLSPEEIEKAKKHTNALPKAEIERCPEPENPPMAPMDPETNTPSHLYSRQISNNQFPNLIPSMFPIGVPGVSGLNPNTPIPPGLYYCQPPLNYDIHQSLEYFQNLHIQNKYSQCQEQYSQSSQINKQNLISCNNNESNSRNRSYNNWHKKWSGNNTDLRQKLIRKRSKSQSCEPNSYEEISHQANECPIKTRDTMTFKIKPQEESPSKYDLSPLKELMSQFSRGTRLFIVVDTEIILNNFPLLNKITDPDENCYLMVPDHVLTELQYLASSGNDVSARRIYRFLSAQIESELAFKGEDLSDVANSDIEKTFITSFELAKENNVILLSNDVKYYKYRKLNDSNVHYLTMYELRILLKGGAVKRAREGKASPTLAIKIVVPNERNVPQNEPVLRHLRSKTPEYEVPQYTFQKKEVSVQSDSIPITSKRMVDTAVQAGDPQYNVDVPQIPTNLNTPESVELEKGSEDSYFCTSRKNKVSTTLPSPYRLKVPSHVKPLIVTTEANSQSQATRILTKLQVTRSNKLNTAASENNIDGTSTNNLITPEAVELGKGSEGSYLTSKPKNQTIQTLPNAYNHTAHICTKPVKIQDGKILNTGREENTLPTSTKRTVENMNLTQNRAENNVGHADYTSISSILPAPVQKVIQKDLEDPHFCKTPTNTMFSHSVTDKTPNLEGSTPNTRYRWRRQRRNDKTKLNQSSFAIVDSTICDQAEPHKAIISVSRVNQESDARPESPRNTSRDHSLDRSSISSHPKTTGHQSIVIEETSTSGIISNTTNDSESLNGAIYPKVKRMIRVRHAEMFEIAGQSMDEVLRTRRDEWVLRFVQIMEEVLREKLRDDSPFQSKDYAAPWATDLPELTRCIIKKYSDYFNVVDAANRLSFTLYRISDERGNMTPNIEPEQFMEMYSFGVYLIQTLKDISVDCEDLKVAEESLKKLLYDIQNANLDPVNNDTFVDDLQESIIDHPEPVCAVEVSTLYPERKNEHEKSTGIDHNESKISYRLRSSTRKPTQIQDKPPQSISTELEKKPTNIEKTFFSSLRLEKRLDVDDASYVKTLDVQDSPKSAEVIKTPAIELRSPMSFDVVKELPVFVSASPKSTNVKSPFKIPPSPNDLLSSPKKQPGQSTATQKSSTDDSNKTNCNTSTDNINTATVQAVVFNFNSIAQYEEKLKNRQINANDDLEDYEEYYDESEYPGNYDETEDYNLETEGEAEQYDEGATEEYTAKKYTNNDEEYIFGENKEYDEIGDLEDGEIRDDVTEVTDAQKFDESQKGKNKKFRLYVRKFVEEIRGSFAALQQLCARCVEEFKKTPDLSPEIKMNLRRARNTVLKISNSLNSILDRESSSQEINIILQLKKVNLQDFVPDEHLRLEYTKLISKCRNQAFAIYKSLTFFMQAAGIGRVG